MNALRQILDRRKRIDLGPHVPGRHARSEIGANLGASLLVGALHSRWTRAEPDFGDRLQRNRPPLAVGTGRFSSVDRSRRSFSESETWIGTWRSESENFALFCSMSPSVAIRIVWLNAAVVTPRFAARSKSRLDRDFGRWRVTHNPRRAKAGSSPSVSDRYAAWFSFTGSSPPR